jgi:hypothetical protein
MRDSVFMLLAAKVVSTAMNDVCLVIPCFNDEIGDCTDRSWSLCGRCGIERVLHGRAPAVNVSWKVIAFD